MNLSETSNVNLLTPVEISQILGCSKQHVYRLLDAGAMKWIDISAPGATRSSRRVTQDELQHYLQRNHSRSLTSVTAL